MARQSKIRQHLNLKLETKTTSASYTRKGSVVHESHKEKVNNKEDDPASSTATNKKKLSPSTMLDKATMKNVMCDCKRKSTLAQLVSAGCLILYSLLLSLPMKVTRMYPP